MLELNNWFFVQLANFLILLFLLNIILFKPMLALFKERDSRTRGALEASKALYADKDEALIQYEVMLVEARSKAQSAYEEMRNAGVDAHKEMLESAYAESAKISSAAGAELDAAVRDARASLSKDIEKFSTQIMNKLVGA